MRAISGEKPSQYQGGRGQQMKRGEVDLLSCENQIWRDTVDRTGTPVDIENGPEGSWCLKCVSPSVMSDCL